MRYRAKLIVLFSSAILLISSLVSSCCTRLERTNKSSGNGSPFANVFFLSRQLFPQEGRGALVWDALTYQAIW